MALTYNLLSKDYLTRPPFHPPSPGRPRPTPLPRHRFDSREVYFLTDLQQATWTPEALPSASLLQEIQKRASTVFVDVGRDNVENAAVTMLTLADPLVTTNTSATGDDSDARVTVAPAGTLRSRT